MREIKFRAWNIITKTMIDLKKITPLALNMDTDGLFIPFSDGLPLMQYTGLHDKNGKEIYEGDILECRCNVIKLKTNKPTGDISVKKYKIEYQTEYSRFQMKNLASNKFERLPINQEVITQFYSIVGNIYESPELLEAV